MVFLCIPDDCGEGEVKRQEEGMHGEDRFWR